MFEDRAYYAARAAEERVTAMASRDIRVRAVHLEMAVRYDALVRGELPSRRWIIGDRRSEAALDHASPHEGAEVAAAGAKVMRMSGRHGR